MIDLDTLTWKCHVCGRERPDARISVYSYKTLYHGVEVQQNVRHCNDRPECVEGAKTVSFLKEDE